MELRLNARPHAWCGHRAATLTSAHVAGDDTSICGRRRHRHTWQETTPAHVAGDDTSTRGRRRHQHAWSAGWGPV